MFLPMLNVIFYSIGDVAKVIIRNGCIDIYRNSFNVSDVGPPKSFPR